MVTKQMCCFLRHCDVQWGALSWFFFHCVLTVVLLMAQLVSSVFLGGLPMKKNILKANNSCLKKEILKTEMLMGH